MVVNFAAFDCNESPTLVLKSLDGTPIQTLGYAFHCVVDLKYNEISTLSFDVPYIVDGVRTPHYDDIIGMRIVDLVGCGQFLLVDPKEENDGIKRIKKCTAYSLEYEFSKKNIFLEAGTFNFFDGIDVSNPNTIVGRIWECLPDWRFDIDTTLIGVYRTFDDTDKKIYDFMKADLQEKYTCIFDFDTYNRIVHVLSTSAKVPTKQIYLSNDSLIKKIEINEDSDTVVTCLDVTGADDVSIRSVNPTGTNKIYNLDYFLNTTNFNNDTIRKWRRWESDCDSYQELYYDTTMIYNMKLLAIVTAQAETADLEAELKSYENVQAAIIQGIAQGVKDQGDLDDINIQIAKCRSDIASSNQKVTIMKDEAEELYKQLANINQDLSFENYFSDSELRVLRRYFLESSFQDNSFVAQTAVSYADNEYTLKLANSTINISASEINNTTDSLGNTITSFIGGRFELGSLTGNIIRATISFNNDGTAIFAGYLEDGSIGEASFSSGNITISGECVAHEGGNYGVTIKNGRLYFTENANEYTKHQVEWELYNYAKQSLVEWSNPSYEFSVSCSNFLRIEDYDIFRKQLTLGEKVYLNLDDDVIEPFVIEAHLEFDNPDAFSISFSNTYKKFDNTFTLYKLLDESVSMGKALSKNSGSYGAFVNSGASSAVKEFMDSALDIAKNAVLSSGNQAITFDDTGIRVRKWADEERTYYEPEEIWIVDNVIAFTDDNWSTAKMAIGKVFDPNLGSYTPAESIYDPNQTYYLRSGDSYVRYSYNADTWAEDFPNLYYKSGGMAYGIVAPYIVGTLLAGQNLIIDTENGCFRVDSSGVYIDSLRFYITHDDGTSDSLVDELDARDDAIAKDLSDALEKINGDIEDIVDGQIVTYYQSDTPNAKTGDLWYVIGKNPDGYATNKLYRFNGKEWDEIEDADIVTAIEKANTAQATADGKIVSYYQDTVPENCGMGDIWYVTGKVDGYTQWKMYRYDGEKWNIVEDGDIPVALKNAADAMAIADKKIVSYYQDEIPTDMSYGDLWYVTGTVEGYTKGKLYRYDGSKWVLVEDADIVTAIEKANTAQATADGKIVSYYQAETPTDCGIGDIWYVTDKNSDGFITGKLYRYDGVGWNLVEDSEIKDVKDEIQKTNQTLSEIIDAEGYLKADMMSGVIDSSKSQMKSATGNVLFDSDGIWLLNAAQKERATKAIWMNENGMLFGSGTASTDPASTWSWTTAINHNGIVADAIAAGKLSGMQIVGGSLNIGNGTFVVDSNGNLKATSGTFSGTVKGATFQDSSGNNMMSGGKFTGDYLDLSGINVGNGNFVVDDSGNVTVKGKIVMGAGSSIAWGQIDETGSTAYKNASSALSTANTAAEDAANAATDAEDAYNMAYDAEQAAGDALEAAEDAAEIAEKIANGTYSGGTFINGTSIYSPEIYGNEISIIPENSTEEGEFSIYGYFAGTLRKMFSMSYFDSIAAPITTLSAWGQLRIESPNISDTITFDGSSEDPCEIRGYLDFSNATVTGLKGSSVAVFG